VGSAHLITKIYFPRLIVPLSAALGGLLDFVIAMFVMGVLIVHYKLILGLSVLLFPFLVVLTFLCAVGVGLWLSALNVQYRDIRYVIPFLVQLWMFVSPVIYPVSMAKGNYLWLLLFNPMSGVIKAYRASILGHQPIDWAFLGLSTVIIFVIFITGLFYFKRMERVFADVV
jgi:lipopolysaccharide transport system permease protein